MEAGKPSTEISPLIGGLVGEWHSIQSPSPGAPVFPSGGLAENEINTKVEAIRIKVV